MIRALARISLVLLAVGLSAGCSSRPPSNVFHHLVTKVNIDDFHRKTRAYRGKIMTLRLVMDHPGAGPGQALASQTDRQVRFLASGPRTGRFPIVVRFPPEVALPEAGNGTELLVTFLCTQGSLQRGNVAKAAETPGSGAVDDD